MRPYFIAISLVLAISLSLSFPTSAHAWGTIGHRMIAETAAILLRTQSPILFEHRFELGSDAVLPDTRFKQHDGNSGKLEGPTHFFDLDYLPSGSVRTVPADFGAAKKHFEAHLSPEKAASIGSLPWRTEQLLDLAWHELQGKSELALFYLGVMAHYSGDAAMPYHATSDYNGWATGQGGIHFYFESDCVDELEPGLSTDVLIQARKKAAVWLKAWGALQDSSRPSQLILALLQDGSDTLPRLRAIDQKRVILKPSQAASKQGALRKSPSVGCPALRPLIVEQLAKGSVMTAYLWSLVLPERADPTHVKKSEFMEQNEPRFIEIDYKTPGFLESRKSRRVLPDWVKPNR